VPDDYQVTNYVVYFNRVDKQLLLFSLEASLKRRGRLFTKNTGLCKLERGCIGTDTCPVLEGEGDACLRRPEAPANGGRNSDGPKVAKFLVG
jgi:hypothetical protein